MRRRCRDCAVLRRRRQEVSGRFRATASFRTLDENDCICRVCLASRRRRMPRVRTGVGLVSGTMLNAGCGRTALAATIAPIRVCETSSSIGAMVFISAHTVGSAPAARKFLEHQAGRESVGQQDHSLPVQLHHAQAFACGEGMLTTPATPSPHGAGARTTGHSGRRDNGRCRGPCLRRAAWHGCRRQEVRRPNSSRRDGVPGNWQRTAE